VLQFLSHSNPGVRLAAVQHVSAFTGTHESREQLFKLNAITPLVRLMGDIPAIAQHVFTCLTNLAEEHNIAISMIETNKVVTKVVECMVEDGEDRNTNQLIGLHASLLSNLTLLPEGCAQLDTMNPSKIYQLVHTLLQRYIEKPEKHPSIGMALVNVAQLNSTRASLILLGPKGVRDFPLFGLFALMSHRDVAVRLVAIGVVHNCCFDVDSHTKLLESGILEYLLSPLRGPSILSEEDKLGLPVSLHAPRSLDDDLRCRLLLLESINLLAYHRQSRIALRESKLYPILRELDKMEEEEGVKEIICNLVHVLVSDETVADQADSGSGHPITGIETQITQSDKEIEEI